MTTFLNLSNHPSASWDADQRQAARALAERVEDQPFPHVHPDAGESDISALADQLVAELPPDTTHAMVQGEFTLVFALVERLRRRGITCLAATSERVVIENPDGTKTTKFSFRRFRAYS